MIIQIAALPKEQVLLALYNYALLESKGFEAQPEMKIAIKMGLGGTLENARALIDQRLENDYFRFDYVDLGAGLIPLKIDLSGFEFDAETYDKHHGEGLAAKAVSAVRQAVISEGENLPKDSTAYLLSVVSVALLNEESSKSNDPESEQTSTFKP